MPFQFILKTNIPLEFESNQTKTLDKTYFKGIVSRDFRPSVFFHDTIPPRTLMHGLKAFCRWLHIRRDVRDNHLQISDSAVPAVSMRPWYWFPRFQWDHGIGSRGFNETMVSVPAVSMRPHDQFPQSQVFPYRKLLVIHVFYYYSSVVLLFSWPKLAIHWWKTVMIAGPAMLEVCSV
jgi:hypothetical protein